MIIVVGFKCDPSNCASQNLLVVIKIGVAVLKKLGCHGVGL